MYPSTYWFANSHKKLMILFLSCSTPKLNSKHTRFFKLWCHIWHSSVQPMLLHMHCCSKSPHRYRTVAYPLGSSWCTNWYLTQLFIGSSASSKCRETSLPWDFPLLSVHHKARICKYKIIALCIFLIFVYFGSGGWESCLKADKCWRSRDKACCEPHVTVGQIL